MKNRFVINGDECIIELRRRNGDALSTWISLSDFPRVSRIKGAWTAKWSPSAKTFYVQSGNPRVLLHRWIIGLRSGRVNRSKIHVDHNDHNGLNNRRKNLTTCSNALNSFNRRGAKPGTISGIRGVSWQDATEKWMVRTIYNGKYYYGGRFNNLEDARLAAERLRILAVSEALL